MFATPSLHWSCAKLFLGVGCISSPSPVSPGRLWEGRMDAPACWFNHKRYRLTSAATRLDQSEAGVADAGSVRRGVYGVISFRKMRHLCRPSHCGSLLFSFLVNNHPQRCPPPTRTFPQQSPGELSLRGTVWCRAVGGQSPGLALSVVLKCTRMTHGEKSCRAHHYVTDRRSVNHQNEEQFR